jgi:hypothetical protein
LKTLSKKDQLKLRAIEAGFQAFEAEAFHYCLARFEYAVRADERQAIGDICDELSNKYEEGTPPMHAWAGIIDELHATITSRRQNI